VEAGVGGGHGGLEIIFETAVEKSVALMNWNGYRIRAAVIAAAKKPIA
jgi:hypothetical protein